MGKPVDKDIVRHVSTERKFFMTEIDGETFNERLRRESRELSDFYKLINARVKEIKVGQMRRKGLRDDTGRRWTRKFKKESN